MDSDRNLLFGALATQTGLITADQFADACSVLVANNASSLPQILCERHWLLAEDLIHVEYLVERYLARFGGDVTASLAGCTAETRTVLASLGDRTNVPGSDMLATLVGDHHVSGQASVGMSSRRYTLNSLHAAGGIGEIWLARDADLCRDVAVKRLQDQKSPSEIVKTRFLREARITGRLDHPGVVPVYEICLDEETGQPYYSMRFLKGRTLTETVNEYHQRRQLSGTESQAFLRLLNAFVIVCNTVAYAHSKGIIHRDLKCDNVILGDFGEVVVIDWGLAKEVGVHEATTAEAAVSPDLAFANPTATLAGHVLGTPAYMAPEQAAGRIDLIGPATDVYGLSAVLYEILCGVPPFLGRSVLEVLQAIQDSPPVRPGVIVPNIPERLESICLRGLAKDPAQRHASADRLAAAVQFWVSDLAERRQAEDERERFFALSLDLLAIIDKDGRLRQTSPAWQRLLGYDREKLANARFSEFIHADDRSAVSNRLATVADIRDVATFDARSNHLDGSYRWISWNVTPIAAESSLYVVGRDITQLKQSQQLFEGVMQSAPDAMVIINAQGRIVMANTQMENVFGYTQVEMCGQPVEMLVPTQHREKHPEKVARFFASSAVRPMGSGIPLRGLHKDGHEFPVEISLSPINAETGKLVAASVRDISNRLRP